MALYDPNESPVEVTTDFTLDDVLAWARTKPRDEVYDYHNHGGCALAQFLRATGRAFNDDSAGGNFWFDDAEELHYLPLAIADALSGLPHSFGALADRLEAARGQ